MTQTQQLEGFTKVASTLAFQNPANWSRADVTGRMVHGTYLGQLEVDPYGKSNYKFLALSDGQTINKEGQEIPFPAGTTIIVNQSGALDAKMSGIELGSEVIVDYDGKITMKKGKFKGKTANTYTVYSKKA